MTRLARPGVLGRLSSPRLVFITNPRDAAASPLDQGETEAAAAWLAGLELWLRAGRVQVWVATSLDLLLLAASQLLPRG